MRNQTLLSHQQISDFIARHRLPDAFRELIACHYSPLASWLKNQRRSVEILFVGINGAQGTGKSTLAAYLRHALEAGAGWQVAVLSIDDSSDTVELNRELLLTQFELGEAGSD